MLFASNSFVTQLSSLQLVLLFAKPITSGKTHILY